MPNDDVARSATVDIAALPGEYGSGGAMS